MEYVCRYEIRIPGAEHGGELLLFEKRETTPEKFPRRAGIPAKRPIQSSAQDSC